MDTKRCVRCVLLALLFFGLSFFLHLQTRAQLIVQNNLTPQQLVQQVLVGGGITVLNVTYTGANIARGSFFNGNSTNLGIDEGIILSSGSVFLVPGVVGTQASVSNGQPGDPQLNTLTAPYTTNDAAVLEFDFIPQADTLTFRYVWGSEEYPEYVCSSFNDAFGFFVTGPNPANPFNPYNNENIAIIPESMPPLPVTINSVNNGSVGSQGSASNCTSLAFSGLYIDNQAIGGTTITYDGFTRTLEAMLIVVPCETYHIKLACGDAGDYIYDSGVFLEANSFGSTGMSTSVGFSNSSIFFGSGVEACNDAVLTFELPEPRSSDYIIAIAEIFGTATLDVDYELFPPFDTLIIPAGSLETQLVISPLSDDLIEGTEEAQFIFLYEEACENTVDTTTIAILDNTLGFAGILGDSVYCVTDPPDTLLGSPPSSGNVSGVFAGPGMNGNVFDPSQASIGKNNIHYYVYFIDQTIFGNDTICYNEYAKEIFVIDGPVVDAGPDDVIAEGQDYTMNSSAFWFDTLDWVTSGTGAFDDPGILQPTYTPSFDDISNGSITLSLHATAQNPCPGDTTDSMVLTIASGTTAIAGEDALICEGDAYQLTGNALFYNTVEWATSGDGTFSDLTILDPLYYPGANDITNGSATLTLNVYGSSTDADIMVLSITAAAIADAGGNASINEGQNFTPDGLASNHTAINWLTSGDGYFPDPTIIGPTYFPGSDDNLSGSVSLSMIVYGQSPCGPDTNTIILTIISGTSADAGTDATICADESYQTEGSGTFFINQQWNSSGDGSFSSPGIIDPIYTPGTQDMQDSIVTLTLTVFGSDTVSSDMTLFIHPLAETPALLESDQNDFCSGAPDEITLTSTGGYGDEVKWFTDACAGVEVGTGTSLTIDAPLETITYYAFWENPCGPSACAQVTVDVIQNLDVQVNVTASQNPIEAGETVVFTATPQHGGSDPEYTWMVDGNIVQTGPQNTWASSAISDGQVVTVELTSSEICTLINPASGEILMGVNFRPSVHAPNAFSPNSDGKNDIFYIYGPIDEISEFQLFIYDRWGTLVFDTRDMQEGWDGTYKGSLAPTGIYVWVANFTIKPSAVVLEGETKKESGNFVLVR